MDTTPTPSPQPGKSDLVVFKPKQLRRFYEPIVLFKALNDISRKWGRIRSPDRSPNPQTDDEEFQLFLDKLALVCDRKKGGTTVTAVTVLDHDEDALTYVIGCNQISAPAREKTSHFVLELLKKVEGFNNLEPLEKPGVRNGIRDFILAYNRPRIECYMNSLLKELGNCIESCSQIDFDDISQIERSLKELETSIGDGVDKKIAEAEYLESCLYCLQRIKEFQRAAPMNTFIDERATEGRLPDHKSMVCWSELRHNLARLLVYEKAVATFIATEAKWSELFQEVKVKSVASSRPDGNPLGKKSEEAQSVIGRMSSHAPTIAKYRKLSLNLEADPYLLNDRIKEQCDKVNFRPIVHCEVLVLNWILAEYTEPRFFRNWRYIGTSKGPCKLCHYYFEAHPSQVKIRPAHGNVYTSWRFADLTKAQGEAGVRGRQNIFNSMMDAVRKDAFLILEEKSPIGKSHDSNTYTFMSHPESDREVEVGGSDTSEVDNLIEQFEAGLSFTNTSTTDSLALSGSDDEEGGTSLF
ncbi:hypothetical protein G7Z17_g3378 [Cylindrodendrum hubeiense]|uniref:Uncharacterized protein n=1 Tax=Cylindrodendrum hubeiense TaxID=595255 RepID=A0A9P5HL92_9HYPO|nr:hypothetical protein G7Z17_g3378 [Cylindrodendrum hubeiense]